MILRGIKKVAPFALMGFVLSGCLAQLPGGETGPFAPGNTLTFYYQGVLTDPPDEAVTVSCDGQIVERSCIRLSNGATFPFEPTETGGVAYGNDELRVVLAPDEGGVPSGLGQVNNLTTGEQRGFRWVSLPTR